MNVSVTKGNGFIVQAMEVASEPAGSEKYVGDYGDRQIGQSEVNGDKTDAYSAKKASLSALASFFSLASAMEAAERSGYGLLARILRGGFARV